MHRFLQSPRGGGWLPEEITVLVGPSAWQLLRLIRRVSADYLLVYFAGHGYAEPVVDWTGRMAVHRCLGINSEEVISDLDLLHPNVGRQLLICDCCRTRPGAAIGAIPETPEAWSFSEDEFYAARWALDWHIRHSDPGEVIVHGAKDGQPAGDSRDGGRFTLKLLEGALNWQTGSEWSPIDIGALVHYAEVMLREEGRGQMPEVVYQSGNLRVPFAIDKPWPWQEAAGDIVPGSIDRRVVQPAPLPNPTKTWLVVGGLLAGALWLANRE